MKASFEVNRSTDFKDNSISQECFYITFNNETFLSSLDRNEMMDLRNSIDYALNDSIPCNKLIKIDLSKQIKDSLINRFLSDFEIPSVIDNECTYYTSREIADYFSNIIDIPISDISKAMVRCGFYFVKKDDGRFYWILKRIK